VTSTRGGTTFSSEEAKRVRAVADQQVLGLKVGRRKAAQSAAWRNTKPL
jgi:hypothetical protein